MVVPDWCHCPGNVCHLDAETLGAVHSSAAHRRHAGGLCLSFYLLSHALHTVPIGFAYAIWSALGIVLITLIGIFVFKQVPDVPAYIGLALIMAGS